MQINYRKYLGMSLGPRQFVSKQSIAVCNQPHCYGNLRAMWDHTLLPSPGRDNIPTFTLAVLDLAS